MYKFILVFTTFLFSNLFAIDAPTLKTPDIGSVGIYTSYTLQCYIVNGITDYNNYTFELDTVPTFDSPMYSSSAGSYYSSYSGGYIGKSNFGSTSLHYGTTYYWRVKATDGTQTSAWSEVRNFTTISSITNDYPTSNQTGLYTSRSIVCDIEENNTTASNYEFEIDTTPNFDSPLHQLTEGSYFSGSWIYKTNSNLLYETTYYWRARVHNSADTSAWTSVWNFTTISGITNDYPANNQTGLYTSRSITCDIEESNTTASNYEFEMDTTPNFDSPLHELTAGSYYSGSWIYKTNSNLLYGTTYYWRARVHNGADTSAWTSVWNFTTLNYITLDYPANNQTGTRTSRSIACDIEESNTIASNYEFEMDTTPNFDSPLHQLTEGSYYSGSWIYKTNSNLLYGTTYYWRARVHNGADTSAWTSVWSFTTLNYITLDYPTNNLIVNKTSQSIICDIEESNTSASNYEFEMDTTPNFDSPLHELTAGSYYSGSWIYKTNSNLLYGTAYYWRARVYNDVDTSAWTSVWNFTTKDYITLDYPYNNSTNVNASQSIVCDVEASNTLATNYEFELDTTPNFDSPFLETSQGDYYSGSWIYKNNSGMRYGQDYYWRARVRNGADTSGWSATWTFKTEYELTTAPSLLLPTNNSTDVSYSSFLIDWDAISNANSYEYQISSTTDFTNTVRSGSTSLTDKTISNLQANTVYYWRVRGENVNGYSPWSTVWDFTTETAVMVAPTLISPANNLTDVDFNSVDFSWNSTFGASEYIFEISQDNTFSTGVTTQNIAGTTNNLTGLNENTQYFWRVASTDGNTTSSWSEVWSFTTNNAIVNIDAPTLLSPANNSTNISLSPTLEWNAVSNATSYEYEYSTDNTFSSSTSGTINNTTIGISNLTENTQYYWRVKATDGTNYSDWSTVWNFTTETITSINNISGNKLLLYPNPASNYIIIESSEFDIQKIEIIDVAGKVLINISNYYNNMMVDISSLQSGIYFVKIGNSTTKFIKK